MRTRYPLLAILELCGAALTGAVVAAVWSALGTAWTWAVDPYARFAPLSPRAVVIIAVPAFAMGWLFFLVRRPALRSRTRWIGAAFACALVGSAVHRAVFLDPQIWHAPAGGLADETELALHVLARHVVGLDFGFLAVGPDTALMAVGTFAAAVALAAATYTPVRRLVS